MEQNNDAEAAWSSTGNYTSPPQEGVPPSAPPEEFHQMKTKLAFSEKTVRAAFVRKVFFLVGCMLSIVVAECCLLMFVPGSDDFVNSTPGYILLGVFSVLFFVLYFVIICVKPLRHRFPINVLLAFVMAGSLGYLVATICTYYTVDSVLLAVCLTLVSTVSIGIFSCQTKFDMTNCIGVIILLCMYLFWISFMSFFYMFYWYDPYWYNLMYSVIACTIFMLYLAIDIQLIMGGHRMSISPEEYIFASVQLFIDIVYIFIYLLQIFGIGKR